MVVRACAGILSTVDDSGTIYLHGLGDLHIHSAIVRMLLPESRLFRFTGWGYAHIGFGQFLGIAQAGLLDVSQRDTLRSYFSSEGVEEERYVRFIGVMYGRMLTVTGKACLNTTSRDENGCFC